MNLAICTSKSETFGHLIVEPILTGIPVVTFNVGTASYLIQDFTTGFVVKDKSQRENFRRMVKLLQRNRNLAKR